MRIISSTTDSWQPIAIALGNFDGIHCGHRQVLEPILDHTTQSSERLYATAVTFTPHPQEFFSGSRRQLLTPVPEKARRLEALGIEQLILLPFDHELAALSPQEFVCEILIERLQVKFISVGEDFRFGCQRTGNANTLQEIAAEFGIQVNIASLKTLEGELDRISSSRIRQALAQGEIDRANRMLGYPYSLTGKVITGAQLGRTLGFPTANLNLPPEKLLPRQGVYCVRVELNQQTPSPLMGVMNLGCRPTVDGTTPTVEVHVLDWSGDLYDRVLTVTLEKFLRPEQKFASLDALKAQIAADCELAREILCLVM